MTHRIHISIMIDKYKKETLFLQGNEKVSKIEKEQKQYALALFLFIYPFNLKQLL